MLEIGKQEDWRKAQSIRSAAVS